MGKLWEGCFHYQNSGCQPLGATAFVFKAPQLGWCGFQRNEDWITKPMYGLSGHWTDLTVEAYTWLRGNGRSVATSRAWSRRTMLEPGHSQVTGHFRDVVSSAWVDFRKEQVEGWTRAGRNGELQRQLRPLL